MQKEKTENKANKCYGLDRYSWNQGDSARYDFQIFEDAEPCLVARGGAAVALPKHGNYIKRK